MKKVNIINLGINGEGVGKDSNNKTCFVFGALEGEEVEVQTVKEGKSFDICNLNKILKASPYRVNAVCPNFGVCGGCNLQHLQYEKTLKYKTNLVKNTLKKIANIEASVLPCVKSDKIHNYRNKATFFVDGKDVGMYQNASHKIVEIDKCYLVYDGINQVYNIIKSVIALDSVDFIKSFTIRQINKEFLITFSVKNKSKEFLDKIIKELKNNNITYGLYINIVKQNSKQNLSENFEFVDGKQLLTSTEFMVTYNIGPYSFLQVNTDVKNKLYSKILGEINSGDNVLDAYSGAGVLSAIISKKCKSVVGVEINPEASSVSQALANQNSIKNMKSICGDCSKVLPKLAKNTQFSAIILDPPKSGATKEVLDATLQIMPDKIIIVACSAISLAKNLRTLLNSNLYFIDYLEPYDMFAQTANIETLCVLKKFTKQ